MNETEEKDPQKTEVQQSRRPWRKPTLREESFTATQMTYSYGGTVDFGIYS